MKQKLETYGEILSMVSLIIFALLAGLEVIRPIGMLVGWVLTFIALGGFYVIIDKTYRRT